jgi:hypothetical protein
MLAGKPTLRRALAWSWLTLGMLAALWSHAAIATGAFGVGIFDQSLRVLQSVFAARGK